MTNYCVLDLETTGTSVKSGGEIIQIGLVVVRDGQVIDRYATFLQPHASIPPFISDLTGISDEDVKDAPTFAEVASIVQKKIKGCVLVAHNAQFDVSFLTHMFDKEQLSLPHIGVLDTVELARILYPTLLSYKLSSLSETLQLTHKRPHRADEDAEATARLLIALEQKLKSFPQWTVNKLSTLSFQMRSGVHAWIEDVRSSYVHWEENDVRYAWMNGWPFARDVQAKHASTYENTTMPVDEPLVLYEVDDRKEAFLDWITANQHILRTEESAYIVVPSPRQVQGEWIEAARRLQLSTSVYKGRHNYLSLAAFARSLHKKSTNYDEALLKMQVLVWLLVTETGDCDELHLSDGAHIFWQTVSSLHHPSSAWKGYQFDERARLQAEQSSLVLTSMTNWIRNENLPKKESVYIYSAHKLAHFARQHYGAKIHFQQARKWYSSVQSLTEIKGTEWMEEVSFEIDSLFQWLADHCLHYDDGSDANPYVQARLPEQGPWMDTFLGFCERLSGYMQEVLASKTVLLPHVLEETKRMIQTLHECVHPSKRALLWGETDKRAMHNYTSLYVRPMLVAPRLQARFESYIRVRLLAPIWSLQGSLQFTLDELGLGQTKGVVLKPRQQRSPISVTLTTTTLTSASAIARKLSTILDMEKKTYVIFPNVELLFDVGELLDVDRRLLYSRQGTQNSLRKLIRAFQEVDQGILLTTFQALEKMDITEKDSTMIVVKVPFFPPKDPLQQAMEHYYRAQGKHGFYAYALPRALQRLACVFRKWDVGEGEWVFLDDRIVNSTYHRAFDQLLTQIGAYVKKED